MVDVNRPCFAPIRAAIGDALTDEEIEAVIIQVAARHDRLALAAGPQAAGDPKLWADAISEAQIDAAEEHWLQRRLAAAAATARNRRDGQYAAMGLRPHQRLRALMVGDESAGAARGYSVDAQAKAGEVDAVSRFTEALQALGQLARLADPFRAFAPDRPFELEVAREVARLNGEQRAPSADPAATKVAEQIVADQARLRAAFNRLGAWIGELPGYVARTVHDPIKISGGFWKGLNPRKRAEAQARWVAFVRDRLDERTFAAVDEAELTRLRAEIEAAAYERGERLSEAAIERRLAAVATTALEAARTRWLSRIWMDIVSGYREHGAIPDDLDGFTPSPSSARALSRRRVLHWKDADAWMDYNREFGSGSLFASHLAFLARGTQQEALMRSFGPAPDAAFQADVRRLRAEARESGDVEAMKALSSPLRQAEFDQLTGAAERPVSVRVQTVSRAIRQWQQMAKLGGMIFSSITDLGNGSQALARAGVAHFETYRGLVDSVANIKDPVTRREVANLVGEGARAVAGDIAAQYTAPDANLGLMFKAQRIFYRANLFQAWQARLRAGAGHVLARHLGERSGSAWAKLEPKSRLALARYGIDEAAWELARGQAQTIDGAGRVVTPDAAERVDGDAVAAWAGKAKVPDPAQLAARRRAAAEALQAVSALDEPPRVGDLWSELSPKERASLEAAGVTKELWSAMRNAGAMRDLTGEVISPAMLDWVQRRTLARELGVPMIYAADDIADARRELMIRLQAYFTDQIDTALTEPRARERAMMRLGTKAGTAAGLAVELIMQFKSFPLAMLTRHVGPAIGDAQMLKAVAPIAHLLMVSTGLGFVAMTMKDINRGLKPMPLTRDDDPTQFGKVFLRAFIQGGGAGLYGDFIFGSYDRFGRSPWAALAGPSVGEAERVLRLAARLRNGDTDVGAGALQLAVDNTPFANLFYTRQALNYLFLYQLQEAANPGYLQRMEDRVRDDRGQEWWAPPSAALAGP
jgi:hypothetical protein